MFKYFILFSLTLISATYCASAVLEDEKDWWKHAVFYQIYPRSFKDNNNDGIGDLQGIISKLHYLKGLGITAVWLSPIYKSPQVDQGYDISDYLDVDPDYGSLDDLKELIETAHDLGIKVVMDLVPNHTSNKHKWFIESENNTLEYKDYYVWANYTLDENGEKQPPNNWISAFRNSSWTWSEKRQLYYLHQFASAQPDLNYRNRKVVDAMNDVLKYWLDFGVDGFRIDAVPFLVEDIDLRDEPRSYDPDADETDFEYLDHIYTQNLPETYDIIYNWRQLVDAYAYQNGGDTRVLMTEVYANESQTMLYYGTPDGKKLGAHFSFNFIFIKDLNINSTAHNYATVINRYLDVLPDIYTPNWVLGNHDNHRVANRLGLENIDGLNILMALLPGVGVTYNGEEFGQTNGNVTYEQGKDPAARDPATFEKLSRDFERTPLQWDNTTNAGFNEGNKTWLPVDKSYLVLNVASQMDEYNVTHYNIYKDVLQLRQTFAGMNGETMIGALSDNIVVLTRDAKDVESLIVFFNIGDKAEEIPIHVTGEIILTSVNSQYKNGQKLEATKIDLKGHECIVLK